MTQEQLTPEQARSKAEDMALEAGNLDFYTNHHYRDHVQELFFKAITQATEPLQREIERANELAKFWHGEFLAENKISLEKTERIMKLQGFCDQQTTISQLKSQNGLLVEALEMVKPFHGTIWGDNKLHPGRIIHNALTNTTQAAQARDKSLREAVLEEAINTLSTKDPAPNGSEIWWLGVYSGRNWAIEKLNQLKGGE